MLYIIGLGNPGIEYENSRHNVGRMALEYVRKKNKFSKWKADSKSESLISVGEITGKKITLALPETYMNNSGRAVYKILGKISPKNLVVVYDELDLPLETVKVSFGRGTGGHRGMESIVTYLKTRDFGRIRIGISPKTPTGKIKKPQGEEKVKNFVLGVFNKREIEMVNAELKKVHEALTLVVQEGILKAMNVINTK